MDQKHRIFSIKIGDFSSFFDHQKSTRRYANSIFDVRYGERKSKFDFRSRDQRYSRNGSKTAYFFYQNRWFFIIFRSEKSTRRYANSIFDVRYGLREKAPRVGFEPTRDFSRPFQGMRQWWLPLRHGRGCGLRGSGSRWCAAGRCRKSMIFRRNWSSKNQHAGCAMGQKPREKHAKIDHFSSKLSVKKSTRWFCNYAQLQLRTRSFRI